MYPYCSDVSSLAKAAVAGDEAAMDMLWRKSAKSSASSSDYSFFFGVEDGKCVCLYSGAYQSFIILINQIFKQPDNGLWNV